MRTMGSQATIITIDYIDRLEFRIIESYRHAIVTLKYEMFTDAFLRQSAKVS